MEIWKTVQEFEQYEVSNLGRIKMTANEATRKERILKPLITSKGYYRVRLFKNNESKFLLIHRLVAIHFLPNLENKETVNHKNGDKSNNSVENLEWNTLRENHNHAIATKLSSNGERNGRAKLTKIQADEIKKSNLSTNQLKEYYGVSKSTIDRIKRGDGWK